MELGYPKPLTQWKNRDCVESMDWPSRHNFGPLRAHKNRAKRPRKLFGPFLRNPDALYTDRTLQPVNGGVQLYFGVEKATCFNWWQDVSFKWCLFLRLQAASGSTACPRAAAPACALREPTLWPPRCPRPMASRTGAPVRFWPVNFIRGPLVDIIQWRFMSNRL